MIPSKAARDKQKLIQSQKIPANVVPQKTDLSVGDTVTHKAFGTGMVKSINETFVEVEFSGNGVKKISKDWIKNCYKNQ